MPEGVNRPRRKDRQGRHSDWVEAREPDLMGPHTDTVRASVLRALEAKRNENSQKIRDGELTINRPKYERIANLTDLKVLTLFQPDFSESADEGGEYSFYRTLNTYLDDMKRGVSTGFTLFVRDDLGRLVEKQLVNYRGDIYFDGVQIFPHSTRGRWRFPEPFLDEIVAYKVCQDGVRYLGVRPYKSNPKLRKLIAQVKGPDEDITMLHYRGHNGYGAGANIPEEVLDPAIVNLGGCISSRYVKRAQKHHSRSGIVALNHKTGWEINHFRARDIMRALAVLKKRNRGNVTWIQLSRYLRTLGERPDRFAEDQMVLPGDELDLAA